MSMMNLTLRIYVLVLTMGFFNSVLANDLNVGESAPDFQLIDQNKKTHTLKDYSGQWVVLYFYPKDDTPGCTKEACNFRDDIVQLRELNAQVLGVSVDNAESHAEFAEKYGLPFPLLSDAEGKLAAEYGSLWKLGPVKVAKRHTFIIDGQGKLAKIYRKVDPDSHSDQVISDLKTLLGSD